ncbi:hypothetical protein ILYODFUR_034154 [Ilyodon furcidens]|uniref:Uncharacterized protein n=1 Tax=Ilyodon furcidens TaxID=33524 RepID=A0ABV0T5V6_9TELE
MQLLNTSHSIDPQCSAFRRCSLRPSGRLSGQTDVSCRWDVWRVLAANYESNRQSKMELEFRLNLISPQLVSEVMLLFLIKLTLINTHTHTHTHDQGRHVCMCVCVHKTC